MSGWGRWRGRGGEGRGSRDYRRKVLRERKGKGGCCRGSGFSLRASI